MKHDYRTRSFVLTRIGVRRSGVCYDEHVLPVDVRHALLEGEGHFRANQTEHVRHALTEQTSAKERK